MMTREDWLINIENAAIKVNAIYGFDVATGIFEKYGSHSLYTLSKCFYDAVFSDLEAMAEEF